MAQEKEFVCPICESTEYETVRDNNQVMGPGFASWVLYHTCSGCSVVFTDVEKFSKK